MNEINYTQGMWADLDHNTNNFNMYNNYFNIDYEAFTREVMAIIAKYKEKEPDIMSPKKKMERMRFDMTK